MVIQHLKEHAEKKDVGVAYIYLDRNDSIALQHLLAIIWEQLLRNRETLSEDVIGVYNRCIQRKTYPGVKDTFGILQSQIRKFSRVFVIVDGLDERQEKFREDMVQEIKKLGSTISLMVTSRFESDKGDIVKEETIQILASTDDMKALIHSRISRSSRLLRHLQEDEELRELIMVTVAEKAKGMSVAIICSFLVIIAPVSNSSIRFLLAKLHMDMLETKTNRKAVKKALDLLPDKLNETFEEALQRIETQGQEDKDLAKRILSWILLVSRPLTVKELQHALAVEPYNYRFDQDAQPYDDILCTVCAGLVVIDNRSSNIRFAHGAISQYLQEKWSAQASNVHNTIAITCLTYLLIDDIAAGPCADVEQFKVRLSNYPLLPYCAIHWGYHVRNSADPEAANMAKTFLSRESAVQSSGQARYSPFFFRNYTASPLQVTIEFGLLSLAESYLDAGDISPAKLSILLPVAVASAEVSVAVRLLKMGADPTNLEPVVREALQRLEFDYNEDEASDLRSTLQARRAIWIGFNPSYLKTRQFTTIFKWEKAKSAKNSLSNIK